MRLQVLSPRGQVAENVGFDAISGFFDSSSAWIDVDIDADVQQIHIGNTAIFVALMGAIQQTLRSHGTRLDALEAESS